MENHSSKKDYRDESKLGKCTTDVLKDFTWCFKYKTHRAMAYPDLLINITPQGHLNSSILAFFCLDTIPPRLLQHLRGNGSHEYVNPSFTSCQSWRIWVLTKLSCINRIGPLRIFLSNSLVWHSYEEFWKQYPVGCLSGVYLMIFLTKQ